MKHHNKLLITLSTALLFTLLSNAGFAEEQTQPALTGNIAATSTYMWRGVAQTQNAAVQGGVKYMSPIGVHAEFWTSSVDIADVGGSEIDLGLGYANKIESFHYDIGVLFYFYPQHDGQDFEELYLGANMGAFGAKISVSDDKGEYYEGDVSLPIAKWEMVLRGGFYRLKDTPDYSDIGLIFNRDLAIFRVSFAMSDTDRSNSDDFRTVVTLSKDFIP